MSKVFYCVIDEPEKARATNNYSLLKEACMARHIEFKELTVPASAYSLQDIPLLPNGGLYVFQTSKRCSQYSYALRLKNPHLKTWNNGSALASKAPWTTTLLAEQRGVRVIPTLYGVTEVVDDELIRRIEHSLGGFPVVLKMDGGSHGSGVMLIESQESLKSVLPHIIMINPQSGYALRQFIRNATHYRVIVLDGRCISVIKYLPQKGDIRTNAVQTPLVEPASIPKDWQQLAVQATQYRNTLFGGVDLLVDTNNEAFIAEVNTPCNFSRNQNCTGENISDQLVCFLCDE